jgi:PLP dependent protein
MPCMSLQTVLQRIENTCARVGRDPNTVKLIAVTKGHTMSEIEAAVLHHGHRALGENRIQEALPKIEARPDLEWHLIGHLQTNKVKFCEPFHTIHSVDSVRLLEEIAKRAVNWARVPRLLLEINVGFEAQKHGANPEELPLLLKVARELGLEISGLMTVAPQDLPRARDSFRMLREMKDAHGLEELSMGMSGDLEVAVEEGATILRVGRSLFETSLYN